MVLIKKYLSGFLLLFIGSISCFGQENEKITLKGVVVDADSLTPLPYVHVRVKNTRLGGATEAGGQFNINVNSHDSIVFTMVGYKPYLLVPADSAQEKLNNLVIAMTPQIYELDEVSVKAYDDITKYIRRKEKPLDMKIQKGTPLFDKKEPEATPAVGMGTGMNGAYLEGGLTAFANLFSDKFQQEKKLKKLLEIEEEEKRQQYLREVMTEKYQEMVLQTTDFRQSDIQRFTDTYMPDPNVMVHMNDYTIMVGILENLRKFTPKTGEEISVEEISKRAVFEGEEKTKQKE